MDSANLSLALVSFTIGYSAWMIVLAVPCSILSVYYYSHTIVLYRFPIACGCLIAFTALFILSSWYKLNIRGGNRQCTSSKSLNGATVIITGGNAGIGKGAAIQMARRGARVIIACRNPQRAETAVREIKAKSGKKDVLFRKLDLASFRSVREFADRILQEEERLDILINNAGIPETTTHGSSSGPPSTEDGLDVCFQANYFGHFLLTHLLLDLLEKSAPSRVVSVTSRLHVIPKTLDFSVGEGNVRYPNLNDYMGSKLANVLFTSELSERMRSTGVTSLVADPGGIFSDMWEKALTPWKLRVLSPLLWLLLCDGDGGANTTVYCAVGDGLESGRVFFDCQPAPPEIVNPLITDAGIKRKLWDVSMKATGLRE